MILTGTELFSWFGPPYCWDDSVKKKFEMIAGLLGICDATQQIYLGLPSWQKEWFERWEKKRQRYAQPAAMVSEGPNTQANETNVEGASVDGV
jgi:hypothetical protein